MPRVGIWAKSHQWNTLVKDDFLVISRLPLGSINLDVCEPWTLTRSEIFPLLDCICFSPKTGKLLLWCILTCHYKCDGVWIHQKGKIELLFAISGAKVPVTSSWREVANHGCCLSHNVKVCDVSYLLISSVHWVIHPYYITCLFIYFCYVPRWNKHSVYEQNMNDSINLNLYTLLYLIIGMAQLCWHCWNTYILKTVLLSYTMLV